MAYPYRYKKAHQSMKETKDVFKHPSEAQRLNGLGPKLCDRMMEELKRHCSDNDIPVPERAKPPKSKRTADDDEDTSSKPAKKARKPKEYVPTLRTGAWALIMALGTLDQDGKHALIKEELIEVAQPYSDSSFTKGSDTTKLYTAWASMKTLESKELVCTRGHPMKRYYLSDDGWDLALRLKAMHDEVEQPPSEAAKDMKDKTHTTTSASSTTRVPPMPVRRLNNDDMDVVYLSSSPEPEEPGMHNLGHEHQSSPNVLVRSDIVDSSASPIILPPGSFDVRLILDSREVRSKTDRDYISEGLRKEGITPITRALPLGDILWIAQVKPGYVNRLRSQNGGDEGPGSDEVMLEHIMERKRLDDLIYSIKDGRYNEQKFRLKKSGIKHVTYIVEDFSISAERCEKYGEAVESVIAAMQVVSDIFVKQTSKLDNTIRYLARFTKELQSRYRDKHIRVVPKKKIEMDSYLTMIEGMRQASPNAILGTTFSTFSALCDKNDSMTLRDIYLKMLLCIQGVTADKAIEISNLWPTPTAFIEAYNARAAGKEKDSMVSDRLGDAIPRKKVAKVLSAKIAAVWG